MTSNDGAPGSQQNRVGTGNIITGGTITNSPVTSVGGRGNTAHITNAPSADMQPWLDLLRNELISIRLDLEQDYEPARAVHRDGALKAVASLEADLSGARAGGPADLKQRVTGLIRTLAPVAEIVGGIAALQAIVSHL